MLRWRAAFVETGCQVQWELPSGPIVKRSATATQQLNSIREEGLPVSHKILVVMPPNRRSELLRQLDGKDIQISLASNVTDAMRKLCSETVYDLVVADSQLVDGSWRDLLQS